MKYAVFADMHANLEAYQAVLGSIEREKVDKYFCVGDVVGYGADPAGCIEITEELDCVTVAGNHDWATVGLVDIGYFNPHAKTAVLWTREAISTRNAEYLKKLQLVYEDDELTMVHGTLNRPEEFQYVPDTRAAYPTMEIMKTKITFIGHSHAAGIFTLENGEPGYSVKPKVNIEPQKKYLVNVGSVGQPRDRDWRAAFCIYDRDNQSIEIKRVEYDIKKTQKKILKAGLPEVLAHRLAEGI